MGLPNSGRARRFGWYWLVLASAATALAASLFFAFAPVSDGSSVLQENPGTGALFGYPLFACVLPVVIPRRRWPRIAAAVLVTPLGLMIFSVGPFYWPTIGLMWLAACDPGL
jgi:hypothetical protein